LSGERANAAARTQDQHRLAGERLKQVHQEQPRATRRQERRRDKVIEPTENSCQWRILGSGHILGVGSRRAKQGNQQPAEQIVPDGNLDAPSPSCSTTPAPSAPSSLSLK
jgi:hypothetical protein